MQTALLHKSLAFFTLLWFDCFQLVNLPLVAQVKEMGVPYMDIDELIPQVHVLSLHLPLLPSMKHILNEQRQVCSCNQQEVQQLMACMQWLIHVQIIMASCHHYHGKLPLTVPTLSGGHSFHVYMSWIGNIQCHKLIYVPIHHMTLIDVRHDPWCMRPLYIALRIAYKLEPHSTGASRRILYR